MGYSGADFGFYGISCGGIFDFICFHRLAKESIDWFIVSPGGGVVSRGGFFILWDIRRVFFYLMGLHICILVLNYVPHYPAPLSTSPPLSQSPSSPLSRSISISTSISISMSNLTLISKRVQNLGFRVQILMLEIQVYIQTESNLGREGGEMGMDVDVRSSYLYHHLYLCTSMP